MEAASDSSAPPRLLKSALFNARSVNNKAVVLSDIILEHKLDLFCLTETWHKESDGLLFNELTPAGYGLFDLPRSSGRGGGIIVLHNQQFNMCPVAVPKSDSFECLALSVSAPLSTAVVTVYRPPNKQIKTFYLNYQICCLFSASGLKEFFSWGISTSIWI